MSKPRYLWHGYIKSILKKYPKVSNKEKKAVEDALSDFSMEGRTDLLDLSEILYFKKKKDMRGAAEILYISYGTAIRRNREILRKVAAYMGLME